MPPTKKGMRQPQAASTSGAKDAVTIAAEPVAARVARPLAMLEKEPNRPLLFGGACSTMNEMALCCSLPAEMPWRIRAIINRTGAA
jgi:hypothetical protein